MCVNLNGIGKIGMTRFTTGVEYVAGCGLAFEVNEMNDVFGVDGGLGLDAVVGSAEKMDFRRHLRGLSECRKGE
jgi:hypothetical protein